MTYTVHPITENTNVWFQGVDKAQRTPEQFVVVGPWNGMETYMRFPNEIEAQKACDILNNGGDWPNFQGPTWSEKERAQAMRACKVKG